jgi:hypothetical protein
VRFAYIGPAALARAATCSFITCGALRAARARRSSRPAIAGFSARPHEAWWIRKRSVSTAAAWKARIPTATTFAVRFTYDVTQKASDQRMKLDEIAVFTLAHGKIPSPR